MKILLISDCATAIKGSLYANEPLEFITIGTSYEDNLTEILAVLEEALSDTEKPVSRIIVYAETALSDGNRQNATGVELVKHIRLTPELKALHKVPVILLHWRSLDSYIHQNRENLLLYSPGIYTVRLPFRTLNLTQYDKGVTTSLIPYLFASEQDEQISDHNFRNKVAIAQFKESLNTPQVRLLEKDLWFKKIYYRNFGEKQTENLDLAWLKWPQLKVLLLDDQQKEWVDVLNELDEELSFTGKSVANEINTLFQNWNRIHTGNISGRRKAGKANEISDYFNSQFRNQYHLLLLDIYFGNSTSGIEDSDGYQLLKRLREWNIYIPVIIFSASLKSIEPLYDIYPFIIGHYIKGYTPLRDFYMMLKKVEAIKELTETCVQITKLKKIFLSEWEGKAFYKKEFYIDSNNQPKQERKKITDADLSDIEFQFDFVLDKISQIVVAFIKTGEDTKKQFQLFSEISLYVGLIQEKRIIKHDIKPEFDKKFKSYFHKSIGIEEHKILNYRHFAAHSAQKFTNRSEYNDWLNLSRDERINDLKESVKTTIVSLLFAK